MTTNENAGGENQITANQSTSNVPEGTDIFTVNEEEGLNQPFLNLEKSLSTGPAKIDQEPIKPKTDESQSGPKDKSGEQSPHNKDLSHNESKDKIKPGTIMTDIQAKERLKVDHAEEFKNKIVVLKPITRQGFRLGLENTPEKFSSMPGTTWRFAPKIKGNTIQTGLGRDEMGLTPAERTERREWLQVQIGKELDADYYSDMSLSLNRNAPNGEKLYLDKAEDFIIYLAMLESDQIANGLHQYKKGEKPFAEWYIENADVEAEYDAADRDLEVEMIRNFGEISDSKKRGLAVMAGLQVTGLKPLACANQLWKWLKSAEKPSDAPARQKLFLEWIRLGDTFINCSALTKYAIEFNIIRKNGAGDYMYGDDMLGQAENEVVQRLMLPKYSEIRMGIQTKVQARL